MTQLNELDYETIENAVMETARGRWFLSEYKKRHSSEDTGTPALLDAINRLEKVITSISRDFPPKQEKKKIIVGRPVAAKKSASKPAQTTKTTALQSEPVAKNSLKFFAKDEDMFANDTIASDAPAKTDKAAGQRFKVFKSSPQENNKDQSKKADTPQTPQPQIAAPAANSKVPDLAMQPTAEEKDRIVVIRSAANTDIDIPLADELSDSTKTEKSKTAAS